MNDAIQTKKADTFLKASNRNISIDVLKCFAAILITNSHMGMADHPEERKAMGENARRLAERDFDRDILGTQFVDFIESI